MARAKKKKTESALAASCHRKLKRIANDLCGIALRRRGIRDEEERLDKKEKRLYARKKAVRQEVRNLFQIHGEDE